MKLENLGIAFIKVTRWLGLSFLILPNYALWRALFSFIYLGALFYDWQWYLALALLFAYLLLGLLRGLPLRRVGLTVLGILGLWLVVGYGGLGQKQILDPNQAPSVPISFWVFDLPQSDTLLHDLRAAGGRLYWGVSNSQLEDEAQRQVLVSNLRRVAPYQIEVYLVPPLSDFLSVPVHKEWMSSVYTVAHFVRTESLTNVKGLIGDAEPPMHIPPGVGADQADFDEAVYNLRQLLDTMQRTYPGLQIGVTSQGVQYLDGLDGDSDLSLMMRCPVDPPGGWDFVNLMTYSSYLSEPQRAYFVYLFEQMMAHRYPVAKVSYLIGLVGGGFPWEPLLDFETLVRDARLSRALGVREVVIFQLNGALQQFGSDFVSRLTDAVNGNTPVSVEVPFSREVSLFAFGVLAADAVLDFRRWPLIGIWLFWTGLSGVLIYKRHDRDRSGK